MNKFLKDLMVLADELNKAEGFNCVVVINEMEKLYDQHVAELKKLHIADVSGSDLVKSDWSLRECFKQLRYDENHHLGLGDIRLTIAQQEEICDLVERFYHCR